MPSISLIVAFRNEEKNLPKLLESILKQNFPKSKLELIFVDDSSEDKGLNVLKKFEESNRYLNIKVFELGKENAGKIGKKQALALALKNANNDFIVLTDADCSFDSNFLLSRIQLFKNSKIKMVSAPVLLHETNSIFKKMQAVENNSLMVSTAATTAAYLPFMSNGANLAFCRNAYLELPENAFRLEEHSGDDLFLLSSFKKHFGSKSIAFEFDKKALVFTHAQASLQAFLNQRIRWVSKAKSYVDFWQIAISLLVLFQNISLVSSLFAGFYNQLYFYLFAVLFAMKFSIDFLVLSVFSRWYGQNKLLKVYPLVAMLYPFFILLSGIAGHFLPYQWKGRKYKLLS
ncbi:MAG: glycosyltransferase [Bacteroidales bacterium]|nr:glycosyltransferase [Bacteroidales bacterium]